MKTFNRIVIEGRLAAPPEEKLSKSTGKFYYVFTVGTDKESADKLPDGKELSADWFKCICFNSGVPALQLKKGQAVKVEGSISVRVREDANYKGKDESGKVRPAWRTEYSVKVTNIRPLVDAEPPVPFGEPAVSGSRG